MGDKIPLKTLKRDAKKIYKDALASVNAYKLVKEHVRLKDNLLFINGKEKADIRKFNRILVFGSGKASVPMAAALEDIFKNRINGGLIITKYGHNTGLKRLEVVEAGHPVPDENGMTATAKITEVLSKSRSEDLIVYILSGGSSALLCAPENGLSLYEKQNVTDLLLRSGADIHEMNIVRKHLSKVKGGKLGAIASPARVINLIVSDVIGNDISTIGSGPFIYDTSTFRDVKRILEKYTIFNLIPGNVKRFIESGLIEGRGETIKEEGNTLRNCTNIIAGDNTVALDTAQKAATELGYNTIIGSSMLKGESREVSMVLSAIAKEILLYDRPLAKPACIIFGGETTVTVKGNGKGGRCQECALAAANEISGLKNIAVLCGGTDGTDGPTDAAGALVDHTTIEKGTNKNLNAEKYLENNDSYSYLKKTGNLIITGPTHSNVMDVILILID